MKGNDMSKTKDILSSLTGTVWKIEVEDFPAVVVNDVHGGDLYQQGKAEYQIKK